MITYKPPADDKYHPRLLAPLFSLWLSDGDSFDLNRFSVRREGDSVTLTPTQEGIGKVRVNGVPLSSLHLLQDGDFVQNAHETYIFQSNPVADRRQRMLKVPENQALRVTPSTRLRELVDLNARGLWIKQKDSFVSWGEIVRIEYSAGKFWPLNSYTVHFTVYQLGREKPTEFRLTLKEQDLLDLLDWFSVVLPFDLSIANPQDVYGGGIRTAFSDAYYAASFEKIIFPAEEGKRTLPASHDVISGFAPTIRCGQLGLWGLSGALALAFVIGQATQNGGMILFSLIFSAMLAVPLFREVKRLLSTWLHSREAHST